jgi:uncharacterized protein DUF2490
MKTRDRISLMAISLLMCSLGVSAQEFRLGVDYERMLPAKMEFTGKFELRNTLVPQNEFYTIFQVGLKHEILKNLSLGGTFRQFLTPTGRSESLLESLDEKRRYTAELVFKYPRFDNGVRLSYRLRYQHSEVPKGKSKDYLRSRLKADYKLIKDLQPYLAIEPYFRLEENEIVKCRLYLGSKINVHRMGMEVSYIFEVKSHDELVRTSHMIGFYFEL